MRPLALGIALLAAGFVAADWPQWRGPERTNVSAETGLLHRPASEGEHVAGTYRQRLMLASGRFAMIDDGTGFQLVPWRPALERHLGREVSGVATGEGRVTWSLERKIGLGI